ncbi:unnamed protein product [Closterium sp. NIES-53]
MRTAYMFTASGISDEFPRELPSGSSSSPQESRGSAQANTRSFREPSSNLVQRPFSFSDSLETDPFEAGILQRVQELMQLWTELLRPGSPYATRDASSDQTSTTSSQRSSSIPASDPDINGTLTESSYTVISDEGSPDMVPMNAAAALAPSDVSSHHPQEAPPLQQQQQQEEEVVEEEEQVPSGEPVPPLGERGEGSVLPPVPPIPPVPPVLPPVAPPVPPHLMNCEAMIKAVTQYERFARGRHGVEEVPWALVREGKRGGSFQEFSQGKKREDASQAGPAEGKEVEEEQRRGEGRGRKLGIAARGGMGKEKERRVGRHGGEIEEGEEDGVRGGVVEGPYPPWVVGADEENYPLTRRVQRDIWLHQHPENCSLPSVKFLYATFVPQSKYGIGAQLTNVAGALALAVASGRVLVLAKFPRAMHGGCEGRKHGRWHCFFAPETSDACRRRAHDLMAKQQSQNPATAEPESNLRAKSNLPAKSDVHSSLPVVRQQDIPGELVWFPPVPALWGEPWLRIPAVIDINGHMQQTTKTGNKDCWWRAQAWRFLMRSPSHYLCAVINRARHAAFGPMAARHVAHTEAAILQAEKLGFAASTLLSGTNQLSAGYPLLDSSQSSLFQSSHPKMPWVPRPIVSMHVRMGDKAKEMRVAGFGTYLHLLSRVRQFDPSATTVWLSTEMQPVVERAIRTPGWDWKVTDIPRMQGEESMPAYEARIGAQRSVENAWVNLLMAAEADYFIGALGSTWSMLIDGLRCTGGKMLAGFLSTSRDRHW